MLSLLGPSYIFHATHSCRPLRVLPLLAVLSNSKSHTPHKFILTFFHGGYHIPVF